MTRPIPPTVTPGDENWDAPMAQNLELMFERPQPLHDETSIANLEAAYPAASNDGCVAVVDDATLGWILVISDGTSYVPIGKQVAFQADSTATTVSDLKNDFNALMAKMQASGAQASS